VLDLISVKNLYWRPAINSHFDILKNINLELKKNEFIVLRGPAGSGKSRLLEILGGRNRPSSGSVKYHNQDIDDLSDARLKEIMRSIGYIPEEPVFLSTRNLYHNVEYVLKLHHMPKEIRFDRIMYILRLTELISKRDVVPLDLSSSEKKVFALAMALAREVDVMLCDFNLSGNAEEEGLMKLLKNTTYKGTGVIVTAKEEADFKTVRVKYIDILNGEN